MRGGKRHVEARTPEAVPAASQAPAWKAGQRLPRARPAPPAPGCPSRAGRCLGVPSPRTFSHPGRRRLRAKSAPDLAPRGARPPVHIRRWGCARRSGCRGPESVPPSVGAPRADRCEGPRGSEREGGGTAGPRGRVAGGSGCGARGLYRGLRAPQEQFRGARAPPLLFPAAAQAAAAEAAAARPAPPPPADAIPRRLLGGGAERHGPR